MNNTPWSFRSFPNHTYDEAEYVAAHTELFGIIFSEIEKSGVKSICDIGCATGIGYKLLQHRDRYAISGIDYISEYIDAFNSRGFTGRVGDIEKGLPFQDEQFDCVIANSILEHTLHPRELAREAYRVVKPGGLAILATPNALSLKLRWAHLRGRNPFHPLIDNLWNQSYMKRCAVLYSKQEIANHFSDFLVQQVHGTFIGSGVWARLQNMMLCDSLRDVVVLVLRKK